MPLLFCGIILSTVAINTAFGQSQKVDTASISLYLQKAKATKADSSLLYLEKAAKLSKQLLEQTPQRGELRNKAMQQFIKSELGIGLFHYRKVDYAKAMEHYKLAYKWAKELKQAFYIGECLFDFAEVYLEQSEYSKAMTHYFEAMQEYTKIDDKISIYWCYIGMGIVQKLCANYNDAIDCYEKALEIAQNASMKAEAAYCFSNLGNVYRKQGNMKKAMEVYEKAITCFNETNDHMAASDCLNNIGNLYMERGDRYRAMDYYNRSMQIEGVSDDPYRMVIRYKNLADAYFDLRDYPNASAFLDKALKLAEKTNDQSLLASCYSQIGNLHIHKGLVNNGMPYMKKAAEIFESIGMKSELSEVLIVMAETEFTSGKTDEALAYASKGEAISKSIGEIKSLANANMCLSKIWEKKGNASKSADYLKKVLQLKDSIFSSDKSRAIEEIEAGFTRTKLENENQILSQKNELQHNKIKTRNIALLSLTVCLTLSLIVIRLVFKSHQNSKALALSEKALKQKEIERLKENLLAKERELTTQTTFITQKNSLLKNLIDELDVLKKEPIASKAQIDKIQKELKQELSPNTWKDFELQFNNVHIGFQDRLLERFSDLSVSERRICAFLRLNMNTRDISLLTGQTFKSIEVARSRIRKKTGINHEENLTDFIMTI